MVEWGPHAERIRTAERNWRQPLEWNRLAEEKQTRFKVFCASLADVFDNQVPAQWRDDLFSLILKTPHLDWLLLTKRIGNVGNMLPVPFDFDSLYPNVWLGITVCNQAEADRDIPRLLTESAAKRFLSMEPLLGPVDLTDICPARGKSGEVHFSALYPGPRRSRMSMVAGAVLNHSETGRFGKMGSDSAAPRLSRPEWTNEFGLIVNGSKQKRPDSTNPQRSGPSDWAECRPRTRARPG
jgi:hypothetical protein